MKRPDFFKRMEEFAQEFREDAYTNKRLMLIWHDCMSMTEWAFEKLLNELLANFPKYNPPQAKEFRKMKTEIERIEYEQEKARRDSEYRRDTIDNLNENQLAQLNLDINKKLREIIGAIHGGDE